MKLKIVYALLFLAGLGIVVNLTASQGGISARTGAPSESNCLSCHNTYALGAGTGSIAITHNIPAAGYTPSTTYTINVIVSYAAKPIFGFDCVILNSANTSMGTLVVTNSTTTKLLTGSNGRSNITHKTNGGLSTGSKTFSFNWTSPAVSSGNATIYAAGVAGNNNGNEFTDYVYVTNLVVSPASINTLSTSAISPVSFCQGQVSINIPFTATGTFVAGNVFTAQLSNSVGSFASPTTLGTLTATSSGTITSTIGLPAISGAGYRIRVVSSNPVTTGSDNGADLSISLNPSISNAGIDQILCTPTTVLSANTPTTGSGLWTILTGSGSISSPTVSNSGLTTIGLGSNTLLWTTSNGSCASSVDTVIITRYANPSISNAGLDQNICTNAGNLSANAPAIGIGAWTLFSGSGSIIAPSNSNSTVSGLGMGINSFIWSISNGNCPVSRDTVILNQFAPVTNANAGMDQTICGANAILAGNTPTTGTGTWTLINGSGILSNPSNPNCSISGLGVGINTFVWSISNGICVPSRDTVIIIQRSLPTLAVAGSDQIACANSTNLNGNIPLVGTGLWTLLSGSGTIVSPNAPNTLINSLGIGSNSFIWTISNSPCADSKDTVVITQSGSITIANAGLDQTICNTTTNLNGNIPVVGIGLWSLASGAATITNSASANSGITGLGLGNNTLIWTISNGTCTPSRDTVILTRLSPPTLSNAGSDQNVCPNNTFLNGNLPVSGIGIWTVYTGSGSFVNSNLPNTQVNGLSIGSNKFIWTITNGICGSTRDTVNITSVGDNSVSNAGLDQTICASITNLSGNTPTSGTGLWSKLSGLGTITSPTLPNSGVTALGVGLNQFIWTITNGVCAPKTDTVSITRKDNPTVSVAGLDQTLCSSTTVLAANTPSIGTGLWTLMSGAATITNPTLANSNVTAMANGTIVLKWTISNSPCVASQSTLTIRNCLNSITTGTISGSPFCLSTSYSLPVPFVTTGIFSGTFSVQLSDSTGSFVNPTIIGSGSTSPIICAIPSATLAGTRYRIRVINNLPATVGSDNAVNLSINNCPPPPTITTGIIVGNPFCTGSSFSISVPFSTTGSFSGYFTAELSDSLGNFANPTILGSGSGSPINGYMPPSTPKGNKYRVRVKNSYPLTLGLANTSNLSINTCNYYSITTGNISGSPFCSNTSYSVSIPFVSTGPFTGSYIAQLSNASGSFSNPVPIGSRAFSPILANLPSNTVVGSNYRIRVINTNPNFIGLDNGNNLEINSCLVIQVDSVKGSPFCSKTSYQISIPFGLTGSFTGPFSAELSDVSGSFAEPVTIGYGYNSPILASIPTGTPIGLNYRVRIVNNNSGKISNANINNLAINSCSVLGLNANLMVDFLVFPNPLIGTDLFFHSNKQGTSLENICLRNFLGEIILETTPKEIGPGKWIIDNLQTLSKGVYFLEIKSGTGMLVKKLILN